MSYRNPQQVVDTQSGQHLAKMQQSIANSFGQFAQKVTATGVNAAAKKQAELRAEALAMAKRNEKTLNDVARSQSTAQNGMATVEGNNPSYDFAAQGMINQMSGVVQQQFKTPEDNAFVQNVERLGSASKAAAANMQVIAEGFIESQGFTAGEEGGMSKYANNKLLQMNLTLAGAPGYSGTKTMEYKRKKDGSIDIYTVVRDAGGNVYTDDSGNEIGRILNNDPAGYTGSVDTIINTVKDAEGTATIGLGINFQNPQKREGVWEIPVIKNGYAYPNIDKFKESISPDAEATVAGWGARNAIVWYNNSRYNKENEHIVPSSSWDTHFDTEGEEAIKEQDLKNKIIEAYKESVVGRTIRLHKGFKLPETKEVEAKLENPADKVFENFNKDLTARANELKGTSDASVEGNIISGTERTRDDAGEVISRPYEYDLSNEGEAWVFYRSLVKDEGRFKGSSKQAVAAMTKLEKLVREDARNRAKGKPSEELPSWINEMTNFMGPPLNDKARASEMIKKYSKQ